MQIGDKLWFGELEWRVLDIQKNKALIITDSIIEQRAYHNQAGEVTWADCELRNYLNTEFYNRFEEADKNKIMTVINENPDNPWYGSMGGKDTEDKIFLLTIEDVVCRYFGDSSSLLYNPGKNQRYWFQRKDKNNSKRKAYFMESGWWWWLRSPGHSNKRAVYIHGDGNIGIQGNGTYKYSSNTLHRLTGDNSGGIRPALWLKLQDITDKTEK